MRAAHVVFLAACQRWEPRYGRYTKYKDAPHRIHYFTYLKYPPHLQRFIYTTNRVERFKCNSKKATHSPDAVQRSMRAPHLRASRGATYLHRSPRGSVGLRLRKRGGRLKE